MKRIMIPTITQPDVPNVNNVVYPRNVFIKAVSDAASSEYKIPFTLGPIEKFAETSVIIPTDKILGYVSVIRDTYIIVDLIDYEEVYKDHPMTVYFIDKCIRGIHEGDFKAYMNYIANVDRQPNMAHTYIDNIVRICYFNLGHSDPRDLSPISVRTAPRYRRRK